MPYEKGLLFKLSQREVITPYVERAFWDDIWSTGGYNIHVDTFPHGSGVDGLFHPSSHSLPEPRLLYYQVHPELAKKNLTPRNSLGLEMSAAVGSAIHAVIQQKLLGVGLVSQEDIEVIARDENPEHGQWTGKVDLMFQDRLVDIKTVTSWGFDSTKVPRPYWVSQVNPYMDFIGVDRCIILLVEIGHPYRMREMIVHKDEKLTQSIFSKWKYVRECIEENTPPPVRCTGCQLDNSMMKSCLSRFTCWDEK